MPACRCPHCSASGRCQCYECMKVAKGEHYVAMHRTNKQFRNAFGLVHKYEGSPLLLLLLLPRTLAAQSVINETYPCIVCKGRGYNYIG